jgi:hypothetical protein
LNHFGQGTATTATPLPFRFQLHNLITTAECNLLQDYNRQYGLDYHRPNETLVTPRRVHNVHKRTVFQNITTNIARRIVSEISTRTNSPTSHLSVDEVVLVHTAPLGQVAHADSQVLRTGAPNHTPHRVWSASIGCTKPSNFKGGFFQFLTADHEIVFSEQLNLGSAVVFTSGLENIHAVSPVTQGERYQLLYWFAKADGGQRDEAQRAIASWLNRNGLTELTRFMREWKTHGLREFIATGAKVARDRLVGRTVLSRIGLNLIEQRRFANALSKHVVAQKMNL